MSIRSTARICDVPKATVMNFGVEMGDACFRFLRDAVRGVEAKRIQLDEIWQFVGCKQKNVDPDREEVQGDVWTYTAIDADTKLILAWEVGPRDQRTANLFLTDLAARVVGRPQITSDGWNGYPFAVSNAFRRDVDFAVLVKRYAGLADPAARTQTRYSAPPCVGAEKRAVVGNPDPKYISTSYVERSNLSIRMACRRFTRLTNAFSRKVENHIAAQAIYFMHSNFARIHGTLRTTPTMAAGLADHVWTHGAVVALLAVAEPKAKRVWSVKRPTLSPEEKAARRVETARARYAAAKNRAKSN